MSTPRRVRRGRRPETEARYRRVFEHVAAGASLKTACRLEGYAYFGFQRTMSEAPDLKERYHQAMAARDVILAPLEERPISRTGLAVFRLNVLGRETPKHMEQWTAWMEDPDSDHIMIVTRPESGKSTFLKDYCLWRIAKDPTMRIAYASASQGHAARQVNAVRNIIEANPKLREYAGELKPGPEQRSYPWSSDAFMVAPRQFTPGEDESDFSMKSYGLTGQIEGARADIFIVDDPDGRRFTPMEREKIFGTILTLVESRLTIGGKLIILTNRWAVDDVAGRIISQEAEEEGLWKIYSSPAILREKDPDDPKDWGEVLWPEKFGAMSKKVGDRWTKKRAWEKVAGARRRLAAAGQMREFYLVYQNDAAGGGLDTAIPEDFIQAAIERGRDYSFGKVPPKAVVLNAQDPASVGGAGMLSLALLPDGSHLVVDVLWGTKTGTSGLLAWLEEFGKYRPLYVALDKQGPNRLYAESPEVRRVCRDQRAIPYLLSTGEDKRVGDFAVTGLAPIVATQLIIPSKTPEDVARTKPLVEQLKQYRSPEWIGGRLVGSSYPFDLVMCLWYAERTVQDKRLDLYKAPESTQTSAWRSPYADSWQGGSWRLTPPGAA